MVADNHSNARFVFIRKTAPSTFIFTKFAEGGFQQACRIATGGGGIGCTDLNFGKDP